jgi:hypothetical protein
MKTAESRTESSTKLCCIFYSALQCIIHGLEATLLSCNKSLMRQLQRTRSLAQQILVGPASATAASRISFRYSDDVELAGGSCAEQMASSPTPLENEARSNVIELSHVRHNANQSWTCSLCAGSKRYQQRDGVGLNLFCTQAHATRFCTLGWSAQC